MKNRWLEGLAFKDNDIRNIEVAKDGLLCRAPRSTIEDLLEAKPQGPKMKVWYFNETKDREIAETDSYTKEILFNPQLLWEAGFRIIT